MHLIFGADHAGFKLKQSLVNFAGEMGLSGIDLTPDFRAGDDYPKAAFEVATRVAKDTNALGVLVCGSGHGMEMAANRLKGVRAFVARGMKDAKLAREHNHANVIVFGGWVTKPAEAKKILKAWLAAKPSKAARHKRRVKQLDA